MKTGLTTLQDLLIQVQQNTKAKRDYLANTRGAVRMVLADGYTHGVAAVLLQEGSTELERFAINDTAHNQMAAHLGIPFKYYTRLLEDHKDLVIAQVNTLFEREPSMRLIRTMHGKVRAFLSDRYARLDNDTVLVNCLPPLTESGIQNELLSCNVSDERMDIKCVYTDPALAFDVGLAPNGQPDIIQPGFAIANSEVGKGSLKIRSFFHRGFCRNGAVYGAEDALEFSRAHLGGRLVEGMNFEVLSERTQKLDDAAIMSAITDVMQALAKPEIVGAMAAKLRSLKNGTSIERPLESLPQLARELELNDAETNSALENLIRDRDYSRWGVLNAVTALANDAPSYERATEIENLATKIINMPLSTWDRIRVPEKVAVAA